MAFSYFNERTVDLVVHCGDWKSLETMIYIAEKAHQRRLPLRGVLGNNDLEVERFTDFVAGWEGDFELQTNLYELILPNGQTLVAYHGHHKPTMRRVVADESYSIVLLGHSHKPKINYDQAKLIVNPGSTAFSIPRSKSWLPSVAIVNTDTLSAEIKFLS